MRTATWHNFLRHAWLWTSGFLAANAAWSFAFELHAGAVFYALFSCALLALFVHQPQQPESPDVHS